jgi:hypothetical protein
MDEEDGFEVYDPVDPTGDIPEADAFDAEMYDQYISAEIMVSKGDNLITAKVLGRKHDRDGNPVGLGHSILCWILMCTKCNFLMVTRKSSLQIQLRRIFTVRSMKKAINFYCSRNYRSSQGWFCYSC